MKTLKMNLIKYVCGLFLLGTFSCGNSEKQTDEKTVKVTAMRIMQSDDVYQREYIGTVESENTVDLSFQVNGNIEKIFVNEGQSVQKGQLLGTLNRVSLESTYNSAKATLAQAQDAFDRQSILYKNNSLPEIKYVEVKTSLDQAKANEQIARKNLNDCNLYAPFSGVIGTRSQEVGANVNAGTVVMSLMNIQTVKIKVAIPENNISDIKTGENCKIKINALNNKEFEGKIIEKGVVAHPISHTYDIKVQLDNSQREIMPGMVCKAFLDNSQRSGGIIVPLKTVQVDASGKNYVWIVDSSNKAEYRGVKTGELLGNGIVIEDGLTNGDTVITEGYQNVSPSVLVEVAK